MNRSVFFGACALLMLAGPGFGHARLLGTVPAADAQLSVAPTSLTLTFNESVKLAKLKLTSAGRAIPLKVDREAPAAASISVALPPLTTGTYDVQWSALTASDGHVIKGGYSFIVH